jgi:hypothetical protein
LVVAGLAGVVVFGAVVVMGVVTAPTVTTVHFPPSLVMFCPLVSPAALSPEKV